MNKNNHLQTLARHPLVLSLYLPSLLLAVAFGILGLIMPLYARSFDVSYGMVGIVLAAEGVGTLIGDIPGGLLLRRFGQRWAMLAGVVGMAFAVLGLFAAGTIALAVLMRVAAGFSWALYGVARHELITTGVAKVHRGRAVALFGGTFRVGRLVGPAVGGILADAFNLRAPLLATAALMVSVGILVFFFVPPSTAEPDKPALHLHGSLLAAVARRHVHTFSTAGLGQMLAQMFRAGRTAIVTLYGSDVLGLDVDDIGFIESLAAGLETVLIFPTGYIMDRFGRKWAVVPSFFIQGAGMALLSLSGGYTGLLLVTLVIAVGNGLGSGTMLTLGSDLAPEEGRGEFLGMWRLIGDMGWMGGPLLTGQAADLITLPMTSFVLAGVGIGASLIFAFLMPETLPRGD